MRMYKLRKVRREVIAAAATAAAMKATETKHNINHIDTTERQQPAKVQRTKNKNAYGNE